MSSGAAVTSCAGQLFLVFRVRQERFALAATEIAEVLARLPLKPIARAPEWVAGVFAHRGQMIPVLDVSALTFGEPAVARTSTRLVLVNYPGNRLLGLILEHASDTLRCRPEEFRPYGLDNRATPYLGPVREDSEGLLQRVEVAALLDERARALLFAADEEGKAP